MDNPTFQKLVRRYASSAKNLIKRAYPDAPDRSFIENSLLTDWGKELVHDEGREVLAERVEILYRFGIPIDDLSQEVLQVFERNNEDEIHEGFTPAPRNLRDAFKYIASLFAYRMLFYKQQNPNHSNPSIIDALPPTTKTIRDFIMGGLSTEIAEKPGYNDNVVRVGENFEWVSSQPFLAALLLTLKDRGYLPNLPPYRFIKTVFTNATTIDQFLRPGVEDEEARYPRIPQKALDAFKGIKQNTEQPKPKKL